MAYLKILSKYISINYFKVPIRIQTECLEVTTEDVENSTCRCPTDKGATSGQKLCRGMKQEAEIDADGNETENHFVSYRSDLCLIFRTSRVRGLPGVSHPKFISLFSARYIKENSEILY